LKNWKKFKEGMLALDSLPLRGQRDINEATLTVYWNVLKDHDDDVIQKAFSWGVKYYWIWFPTPKEIRDVAIEIEEKNRKLLESEKQDTKFRKMRNEEAEIPANVKPLIKKITAGMKL